jgi:hypothetical protein
MHNEPLAGRCQRHPSPAPLDEGNADFVFQLGDLLGHGRRGNAERISNRCHRLAARELAKRAQSEEIQACFSS